MKKVKPTRADMKWIMPEAIDAFWAVIEKHYKNFGIGHSINDLSTEMKFSKAAEEAVTAWVEANYLKESTEQQSAIKSFETYFEGVPDDAKLWDVAKLGKLFDVNPKDIESVDYVFGKLVIWYVDNDPDTHPAFRGQTVDQNIKMSQSEAYKYKK